MPDAHWGYGFPIGGVAAFDADDGGVVSAGGVGFDISCGVRTLLTGLTRERTSLPVQRRLADALFATIPAGVGSTGALRLNAAADGRDARAAARVGPWSRASARPADLERIEEARLQSPGADPATVSDAGQATAARRDGNAGLRQPLPRGPGRRRDLRCRHRRAPSDSHVGDVVISIHCGSRGLGHQIGTELPAARWRCGAAAAGIAAAGPRTRLRPDPFAGRAALPRRNARGDQLRTRQPADPHPPRARRLFGSVLPEARLALLYDVSHNTCKVETARRRRRAASALRAPQGGDARVRARAIRICRRHCARPASRC